MGDIMDKCQNNDFSSFADWLMTLSPLEFSTLGVITSYIIASRLTVNQQNSIGNWLEMVGQIILTFNAQGSNKYYNLSNEEYYDLKSKVDYLIKKQNTNNC